MLRLSRKAAIAAVSLIVASLGPAAAGSGANTHWYSNVNTNSVIIRDGGMFRVVDRKSGFMLFDDGYCKKAAKPADAGVAQRLKSKLVYFCSRTDKRGDPKWAWTEAEFHLTNDQGRDIWRLVWVNATEPDERPFNANGRLQAKAVVEYASYDQVLDNIPCTVTFTKFGDQYEMINLSSPFGTCAERKVKDGKLPAGEFTCEPGVDETFLKNRKVKIVNRGDAASPDIHLAVAGRTEKMCSIAKE